MQSRYDFEQAKTVTEFFVSEREAEEKLRRTNSVLLKRQKIGRNAPCPCGSGRKFKKCHLGRAEAGDISFA